MYEFLQLHPDHLPVTVDDELHDYFYEPQNQSDHSQQANAYQLDRHQIDPLKHLEHAILPSWLNGRPSQQVID
jgi:hypothetical protein